MMLGKLPRLVAFAGVAGVGKDEAARCLLRLGYWRHNFGDIIKRQLDPLVRLHFNFSAFTEDRSQKEQIRRTLESWGEDNYDAILAEFLRHVPERVWVVNTRLVRVREAVAWKERGGVIVLIERYGQLAATRWEEDRLEELRQYSFDASVLNDGTPEDLHRKVLAVLMGLAK